MKTYWFWLGSRCLGCAKAENESAARIKMSDNTNVTISCDRLNHESPSDYIRALNRSTATVY
jgi:hypothetical protein